MTIKSAQKHSKKLDPCLNCGQLGASLPKQPYCPDCIDQWRIEATQWQERDYLHRYLHTRSDDDGPQVRRLRKAAKALGIDWTDDPPPPMVFAQRVAAITGRGRGRKRTA